MKNQTEGAAAESGLTCPDELKTFLSDLLAVLHLQAKETERLSGHVEQHAERLLTPSQMPMVISELSALHARLESQQKLPG